MFKLTNNIQFVLVPQDSPSDSEVEITSVFVNNNKFVRKGEALFEVEGSKAIYECYSEFTGYFYTKIQIGELVKVNQAIGLVTSSELNIETINKYEDLLAGANTKAHETSIYNTLENKVTRKAQEYLEKLGEIDIPAVLRDKDIITVEDLKTYFEVIDRNVKIEKSILTNNNLTKRKYVFFGGGNTAILAINCLRDYNDIEIVGYFQPDNKALLQEIEANYLGDLDEEAVRKALDQIEYDEIVVAFGSSPSLIKMALDICKNLNLSTGSVIHPSVSVSHGVKIGRGSIILAGTNIGPYAEIGDGVFISSNSNIDHHCKIGNYVSSGPNLNLSGNVSIEEGVRFGISVSCEPNITIGTRSIISSGITITKSIDPDSKVKARN